MGSQQVGQYDEPSNPILHLLQDKLKKVLQRCAGVNEEAYERVQSLILHLAVNPRLHREIVSSKESICATVLDPRYKKILGTFITFSQGDVSLCKTWIVDQVRDLEEEWLEVKEQGNIFGDSLQTPERAVL